MQIRDVLIVVVLCGSLGFWAGGSWAEETVPPSGTSTEGTNTPGSEVTEGTADIETTVHLPEMKYYLENNDVTIAVTGISFDEVVGFFFNGIDITQSVVAMLDSGSMVKETTASDKRFTLQFVLENPASLEGSTLGLLLESGVQVSNIIKFEQQPLADKGFNVNANISLNANQIINQYLASSNGIQYVEGTVRMVTNYSPCNYPPMKWDSSCSWPIDKANVTLEIRVRNGSGGETWGGSKSATTDNQGYFSFGQITVNNKPYCGPVRVSASWEYILKGKKYTAQQSDDGRTCTWPWQGRKFTLEAIYK
jgi:hypothetical protein